MKYTKEELKEVLDAHTLWLALKGGERANLSGTDLSGANLRGTNLRSADLSGANLSDTNLSDTDLSGANLSGTDLRGADLRGADLRGADLRGTNLRSANLRGADLSDTKYIPANIAATLLSCPETGDFEAWKKCQGGVIVKLLVPSSARRSSATTRKCRAEFAKVLEVFGAKVGISSHDGVTQYEKGKTVKCDKWEGSRWIECGGGIHFFITRAEAEAY